VTQVQPGSSRKGLAQTVAAGFTRLTTVGVRWKSSVNNRLKPLLKWAGRPLHFVARYMPKGLYPRALVIVIAPVVLLQSVIAYVFMERHWQTVTQRLSSAVSADIAMMIDVYESYPHDADASILSRIAAERLGMDVDIIPDADLPPPGPRPFFSLLDSALSAELASQVARPFWLDTVGRSSLIEIRIKLGKNVMRILTRRNSAYASNSHIFLLWMLGTSLILLTIAVLFLRNQIRPILKLVERAVGERTTMLNGVSHDLRTILTRFKLSLALLERSSEIEALEKDVDEMARMLEDYLAFARGDAGEVAVETDIRALMEELKSDAERQGHQTELTVVGDPLVVIRPDAFRRLMTNLVSNAARFGDRIAIRATHDARYLIVMVDDDGPGIPQDQREDVFRPFFRLDEARNVDSGGTGLGLAIARDIARAHGGDIMLGDSPLGGLRATVRLPV
jgi:two-component system osmolarity sensor histidine kinase EnvZ